MYIGYGKYLTGKHSFRQTLPEHNTSSNNANARRHGQHSNV